MLGNVLAGILGELLAVGLYLSSGYQIRGWRKRFGLLEADLIVKRGEDFRVVEVKTGKFGGRPDPERMFTSEKIDNLHRICRSLGAKSASVDLVAVDLSRWLPKVRRYPSVCLW
jgi:Holliday junction resolvase-like predicted endonuclease